MNRIRSLISARWRNVFGLPFLLAVFLAASGLQGAEATPAARRAVMLDKQTANRLLIRIVKPHYPPVARVNYIQGVVRLRITVSPKGKVAELHVVEGEPILAAAAIEAVQKWRYRPYISSEGPAPFRAIIALKFAIRRHSFGPHSHFPSNPEGYLEKQIHPPEVVAHPQADPSDDNVKFRVLVNAKGKVLDAVPMQGKRSKAEQAQENLRHWKFRPAHWGALAVPWYLIVRVPLVHALVDHADGSASR
ncbi:MAG: TonB family protein [Acidobacteriota bacterium]